MTQQDAATPRRPQWIEEHLRRYKETNGEEGHIWRGVPTLLLTTTGRRTGEPYMTPLIYGEDDGRYIIVASRGGADAHPQWYRNLVAQPEVGVQVKADRFRARARTASAEEKPRLWQLMAQIWPAYNDYQARTSREIPVVILERI